MISHPQDEFENGEQIEEGASQVEPRKLLQDGTLWIRSLGLGLTLDNLLVDEVTLRIPPTFLRLGVAVDRGCVGAGDRPSVPARA